MGKILVVDDMMVSLMITENILASEYETVTASSGREAMEVYRKEKPDMVLSDFRMPGMTGFELQVALQEEYHTAIPFMFMTADATEETESKGFANGAKDFIRKPINPDLLLRRVGNIMRNIEHIEDLKESASIDKLTKLLNKGASEEKLKAVCKEASGALMMIDLDSFKLVNDIHGHAMGDQILISFADIIRSAMRPDDIVGRLGGDEFIAFCYGLTNEEGVANKTKDINERLVEAAKKLMGEDMDIPLGASVGCVFVPAEGNQFPDLSKKADKALYVVKQNGKHGYHVFSEQKAETEEDEIEANALSHVEMILSERNQVGALLLPMEGFRAVYRFLRRTLEIYGKPDCIVLLNLERGANAKIPIMEAGDEFLEMLRATLRKGDAVARNGNHQFLALLSNTDEDGIEAAVERIREKWKEWLSDEGYTISYEWSELKK